MNVLILVAALAAFFELLWASHPVLRAHRAHFRAMVALFWGLTTLIWAGDAWGLLPAGLYFDGVPRFASDAVTYQAQGAYVADGLRDASTAELTDWQVFNYARLVGVVFYLFDDSRLAASLVNAVFYMASVVSVFLVGRRLFDDRAGLWAAWLAACWPVFLLYETQTLRWVGTTAGLHLTALGTIGAMGSGRLSRSLVCGLAGYAILVLDMPQMGRMAYVVAFAVAAALLIYDLRARVRPIRAARVVVLALAMALGYDLIWVGAARTSWDAAAGAARASWDAATDSATSVWQWAMEGDPVDQPQAGRDAAAPSAAPGAAAPSAAPGAPGSTAAVRPRRPVPTLPDEPGRGPLPESFRLPDPVDAFDRLVAPILKSRSGYIWQNLELRRDGITVGTMWDAPQLPHSRECLANVPSALVTAVVEPTPAMLLRSTCGASRLGSLVAVEMLAYYVLLGVMLAGLWQSLVRSPDSMLVAAYLVLFTLVAYTIIGTIAMNGGTLHRFRLPFVLLHMVFAAPLLAAWVPAALQRIRKALAGS